MNIRRSSDDYYQLAIYKGFPLNKKHNFFKCHAKLNSRLFISTPQLLDV